ncbi:porin [Nannocystis pusilla]|uniref:OprO/OprP family phosphate-selective porin n=1 Tax=Nannocystis pusilla TaxID=889268 RepID=A0ABS7TTB1_9BACT|nr:porin [Nannocystis pusilla]MBZ5711401.1 OprO/OprP family phosphate-selective porin [Nannocystis pusilla]
MRPLVLLRCVATLLVLGVAGPAWANPPAPVLPEPSGPPPAPPPWMPRNEAQRTAEVPVGRALWRPGRGIELATPNRRFTLNINMWAQLLYTARREAIPAAGMEPWSNSLEFRRARLILSGNIFTPHVGYYVHLMFAPKDLGFKDGTPRRAPIFQWYTTWTRYRHVNLQAGFFFVPYARQRMQPLAKLQMVDNSSASYEFTLDQDIGVQVSSPDVAGLGKLRYFAGVFMGEGYEFYKARDFGLTYMARVDYLPLGMFDDYSEADHERSARPRLSIGAAYAFSDRDHRTRAIGGTAFADGGTMRSNNVTVDLMFKIAGMSLLLDFYWRQGWRLPGGLLDMSGMPAPVETARNGVGWTAQMGLFIPRTRVELTARSSGVRPSRRVDTSLARLDEYGAGVNYYFYRHSLKLQLDYFRQWGPGLPAGVADQLRLQLQAGF